MNYERVKKDCQERQAQRLIQLQRLKDGFIPTGGPMVACDFYVAVPGQPGKTQRARVWQRSMEWLMTQLEAQGQGIEQLALMGEGAAAQLAPLMPSGGGPGAAQGQGMPGMRPAPMAGPPRMPMQGGPAQGVPNYGRPRIPVPVG